MGNGQMHGYYEGGLSLLGGWLPWAVQIVVAILIVVAVGWRPRRWLLLWLPVSVVVGVLVMFGVMAYLVDQGAVTDPAPTQFWVWIAAAGATVVIAIAGWRGIRWWRRAISVVVVPLSLLCVALVLNQWVGYFPTAQEAWGAITSQPLPDQVSQSDLASLRGKGATMTTGRVVAVDIPDTASHFVHREEYVYLPPAWFTGPKPPALPVIMMIPGEYNTAADWMRSGNAQAVMDRYVQSHHGVAPILVFVDPGGTFNNDTECVNGTRGNAADHLTKDVRPYVISQFGAAADPAKWGIVGWSMGGTCATDLALMHPELFSTFENIAGDIAPNTGSKQQTIQRLFNGNAAAYASYDSVSILAHHPPYADTAAWYDDTNGVGARPPHGRQGPAGGHPGGGHPGGEHPGYGHGGGGWGNFGDELAEARQLCAAGSKDGIQCTVQTQSGGHTWQFANQAFVDALPWMDARLERAPGVPAPPIPQSTM